MAHWGEVRYRDPEHTPVPLRTDRCPRTFLGKGQHACKLHVGHSTDHRCICGEKWAKEKVESCA